MRIDVFGWIELCWICIQFRLKATKVPAKFFVSRASAPWQHVLIDFEGPMTPADIEGIGTFLPTLAWCAWDRTLSR